MSDANRIVDAILNAITARDEDTRREAGEALETIMHEIACAHVMSAARTARRAPAQDLPDGWTRKPDDRYGPVFHGPCGERVEVGTVDRASAYIVDRNCEGIPVVVLRAFLAALDAENGAP